MAQASSQSRYQEEAGTFLNIMDEMAPHIGLDYSVDSLQRLEQFIMENFDPPGSRFVGETLPVGIGCYVGEVIIRRLGGHWNVDGKPEINGIGPIEAIFPIDKALKRFTEGREHALPWYYHSVAKHAYEAGMTGQGENSGENTGENTMVLQPHQPQHDEFADPSEGGGLMGLLKGLFKR